MRTSQSILIIVLAFIFGFVAVIAIPALNGRSKEWTTPKVANSVIEATRANNHAKQ